MSNALLKVYAQLTNLVGADVEAIYAVSLPPDAVFPCVVYGQIFGGDGVNVSGDGSTYRMRVQIDLFHPVFADLLTLRRVILDGFYQYVDPPILGVRVDMDVPYIMDELDSGQPNVYRHIIDLGLDIDRAAD